MCVKVNIPCALDHINQIVDCRVWVADLSQQRRLSITQSCDRTKACINVHCTHSDVTVVGAVLLANGSDDVFVKVVLGDCRTATTRTTSIAQLQHCNTLMCARTGGTESNAALFLLAEGDVGRLLVQTDAEALQLVLNDLLVGQWTASAHIASHQVIESMLRAREQRSCSPCGVQHDADHVASTGCADDLLTTTFAILGTLNDTRQIQDLNLGACEAVDAQNSVPL